jgi:LPS-assembly protein
MSRRLYRARRARATPGRCRQIPYARRLGRLMLFSLWLSGAPAVFAQAAPQPAPQAGQPPAPQPAPAEGTTTTQGATTRTPDQFSDHFEMVSANHWRLTGNVEMTIPPGTFKFFADEADYYIEENRLVAKGNVVFADADGRIAADEVAFNMNDGTGTFKNASGSMGLGNAVRSSAGAFPGQDPDVYFYGEVIEKVAARKYRITKGAFTTCVQPTPRWQMTTSSATINLDDYAFARSTVLKVKGFPVLYLPAIYYPIQSDGRATGFLMPTYGASSIRGQALTNGFFWALGRSQDATFVHDWYTKSGWGAGGEYRYVVDSQSRCTVRVYNFSQSETTYSETGVTVPAGQSFQLTGTANQLIGTRFRARGFVDYFSDILTQKLYNQNVYQATQSRRTVEGSLSGNFGVTSTSALFQRTEYLTDRTSSSVYGSTPRVSAAVAPQMLFGRPIYASVNSDFARIPNQRLENGVVITDDTLNKWDLAPMLRAPLSRLTFLSANASASYRTTYYSRSRDENNKLTDIPVTRQFLNLRSEIIGPVLTKIWDTPGSATIERRKHVIEPTFAIDYTTDINNQAQVPLLNDASDFIVGGAARVTYGVTNRWFYRSRPGDGQRSQTREYLTVNVSETYYTDPDSSLVDTTYVSYSQRPKEVSLSPIAVTARFSPAMGFDTNARVEYDVSGNGLQIFSVGSNINGEVLSGNLSYNRQQPSPTSTVTSYMSGSSSLRLAQGKVTGLYALSWDIARGYVVSQTLAGQYMAQCCGFTMEAQIFNYPENAGYPLAADRRFNVAVVLAGLGKISSFFGAFGGLGSN